MVRLPRSLLARELMQGTEKPPVRPKTTNATISADPDDVDLSTLAPAGMPDSRLQSMMQPNAFSDRFAGTDSPGPTPDLNDIFAQMLGGAGGQGGGAAANPLLAQMMAGAQGQGQPQPQQPPRPKTWFERLLPLVHLIAMIALAVYAVFIVEPRNRLFSGIPSSEGQVSWRAWADLLGENRRGKMLQVLPSSLGEVVRSSDAYVLLAGSNSDAQPLFYLFVTVELVLQSAHIFMTRVRPPDPLSCPSRAHHAQNAPAPPGMIAMILPYLPPPLPLYASTALKYWALIGTLLDDFAVLLVSMGLLVLLAEWRSGA